MNQTPTGTEEQESEGGGIDSIISTVDSYILDPKLITPQTLEQLKSDLMDLKSYLDGEETQEPMESESEPSPMAEMIKKHGGMQ